MDDFAPGTGLDGLAQLSQVHGNTVAVVGTEAGACTSWVTSMRWGTAW